MQKNKFFAVVFLCFSSLLADAYSPRTKNEDSTWLKSRDFAQGRKRNQKSKTTHTRIIERAIRKVKSTFPLNATFNIDDQWPNGYQVTVTLQNNTPNPTTSWQATFSLSSNQKVTDFWNGVVTTSGSSVTVANPQWTDGGVIPGNSSTTFGLIISRPLNSHTAGINNLLAVANGSVVISIPQAPVLNPITVNSTILNDYTVSWNNVANATSYSLQQDVTSSFSNPTVVAQGSMISQSFTNQANGTYYYRVAASNSAGMSPYSNTQQIVINIQPITLNAPTAQAISNASGANQFQVSWTAVTGAQSYALQQSQTANFATYSTVFNGDNTSAQVSVTATGTYYYRVVASAGTAMSSPSNIVSTIVTQIPVQPKFFIDSYWESWNSQDPVTAIVNMHVDIINIAFANFNTTGLHTYQIAGVESDAATLKQLVTAAHSLNKKVKISVGGATYPLAPQLQTTQDAVGMAQAVAQYVQANSLDGVDYDIEDSPSAALQIALLQNTRQLLPNQLVTYTPKSPASSTSPYEQVIKGAYQYIDYLSIMAYDYAPGYTYQSDVQALLAMGIPASKIVIGLMPGPDDQGVETSVADITTAADYIKQNNLAGIMFWDLNTDYENLTGLGQDAATDTAWNIFNS